MYFFFLNLIKWILKVNVKQINSISDNKKLKWLKEEIINDEVLTPLHKLMLNEKSMRRL